MKSVVDRRIASRRWMLLCLIVSACALPACTHPPNDKYDGRCNLDIPHSPEVRGLRLGMTVEQVKARFPALTIPPAGETGISGVTLDRSSSSESVQYGLDLEGVKSINFLFLDGKIYDISVDYEHRTERLSDYEFKSKLSETYHLPAFYGRDLDCYDFRFTAYGADTGYFKIHLQDVAAFKTLMARIAPTAERVERQKYEKERQESEQRKGAFKP